MSQLLVRLSVAVGLIVLVVVITLLVGLSQSSSKSKARTAKSRIERADKRVEGIRLLQEHLVDTMKEKEEDRVAALSHHTPTTTPLTRTPTGLQNIDESLLNRMTPPKVEPKFVREDPITPLADTPDASLFSSIKLDDILSKEEQQVLRAKNPATLRELLEMARTIIDGRSGEVDEEVTVEPLLKKNDLSDEEDDVVEAIPVPRYRAGDILVNPMYAGPFPTGSFPVPTFQVRGQWHATMHTPRYCQHHRPIRGFQVEPTDSPGVRVEDVTDAPDVVEKQQPDPILIDDVANVADVD